MPFREVCNFNFTTIVLRIRMHANNGLYSINTASVCMGKIWHQVSHKPFFWSDSSKMNPIKALSRPIQMQEYEVYTGAQVEKYVGGGA